MVAYGLTRVLEFMLLGLIHALNVRAYHSVSTCEVQSAHGRLNSILNPIKR